MHAFARLPCSHSRACHARTMLMVARAMRAGCSITRTAPSLVIALMRVPRLVVLAPSTLSQHHPWKTLSRHKIFYPDQNVPPLGKLCRDTRRPLSRPKPGPAPNPVTTLNFCRDTWPKNLCCDPTNPACLGTVSRNGDPCSDTKPKISIACCVVARAS